VNFTEQAGKTTVTLNWLPYEATADERRVFDSNLENMKAGWGGTFDQFGTYLAGIQPKGSV